MVYVPVHRDKSALIIELKHNKPAESGLWQIKDKHYQDQLLLVGISYDEKAKTHGYKIEKSDKLGNDGSVKLEVYINDV